MSPGTASFDPIAFTIALGAGLLFAAILALCYLVADRRKATIRRELLRFLGRDPERVPGTFGFREEKG
jgi:hypothetical protein